MLALLTGALGLARFRPLDVEKRVSETLAQMTLDEKIDLLGGIDGFDIRGVPRLGVPRLRLSDGPVGVRNFGPTTAYPAGASLAATWDPALANRFGQSIGRDARARGVHVWLGPGMNLARVPQNGRNFEYLGEDPLLAGTMAAEIVRGVQDQGVVATIKHFAGNEHEDDRNRDSSIVSERVLRELYLKPFQMAAEQGGAWAAMCGYNKLNGIYCAENGWLLKKVLKQDWGFKGVVMSDWGAVHSTKGTVLNGLDLEMPGPEFMNRTTLKPLLADGTVSLSVIDDKVRRILRMTFAMGFDQRPQTLESISKDDPANRAAALEVAREGTVLLKNAGNILPFKPSDQRIVVLGPNSSRPVTGGGGSSYTQPVHPTSFLDALKKEAGPGRKVVSYDFPGFEMAHAQKFIGFRLPNSNRAGLRLERFENKSLLGNPSSVHDVSRIDINQETKSQPVDQNYSLRWTGQLVVPNTGNYLLMTRSDDGIRVFVDGKKVLDRWFDHGALEADQPLSLDSSRPHQLKVEYYQGRGDAVAQVGLLAENEVFGKELASADLAHADAVVLCVGFNEGMEGEGADRPFDLPFGQSLLVKQVLAKSKRVILVNNSGAGVNLAPFVGKAQAVVQAWYPGGEGNRAIAEILLGKVNPSGKLPTTFPATLKGTYYETAYPPINHKIRYSEGLLMGYRWFDFYGKSPLYRFGYGLSYTKFKLSKPSLTLGKDGYGINLTVRNTGKRSGAEVVQVYSETSVKTAGEPVRRLCGFQRVTLRSGEAKQIQVAVPRQNLLNWSTEKQRWVPRPGASIFRVGTSSGTLPIRLSVR